MPHIINGIECRSKIESLQHILDQAKKGKLGPNTEKGDGRGDCSYLYPSGNHCAVGCLFSEAQIQAIINEDVNESDVALIVDTFGRKNIEAVTGMTFEELRDLQTLHDHAFGSYLATREDSIAMITSKVKTLLARAIVQV